VTISGLESAADLSAGYRRGQWSAVEVTQAMLERISRLDGSSNAFVTVTSERALEDARQADQALRDGRAGPLCGVPYTLKDLVPTRGLATGYGSRVWRDPFPTADVPVAERMAVSGGILLGKTTTPEYGFKGDSGNPLNGPCPNPWRPDRTPGGSSSGAAVAAALGYGPLHQGSDGAGSIRIPASFCGVFGMKPSFGLIAHPEAAGFALSHLGPITRTVADAALLLDAMVGFDPRDRLSVPSPVASFAAELEVPLGPLRIAFSPDLGYGVVEPEVASCVERAAGSFERLGHAVEQVELGLDDPWWIERELWISMFAALHPIDPEHRAQVSPGLVRLVDQAAERDSRAVGRALVARSTLTLELEQRLAGYDLLLSPTLPCTAFPLGEDQPASVGGRAFHDLGWTQFCYPFNITGQPAASVPCGFAGGLPVGLQIVGRRLGDALVLRAAAAYERDHPFRLPPDRDRSGLSGGDSGGSGGRLDGVEPVQPRPGLELLEGRSRLAEQ
jgi:aspartyl-tRNA(Asn)/glutamyl-tRNA(Gln) amidotransferase subunit A